MSKQELRSHNERFQKYSKFKAEALEQITQRGHGVFEVSIRLSVSDKSLYKWLPEIDLQKQPQFSNDDAALKQEVVECLK